MNQFGNSNTPFFQIVKTSQNIKDITERISDRLIITRQGKLYFDYSDSERIEISTLSEQYFAKDIEFTEVNSEMVINNTDIVSTNGNAVLEPAANTLIFDKNGNMGIVISQDDNGPEDLDDTVTILVLTKNFTAKQIMDLLTIKRYYYD